MISGKETGGLFKCLVYNGGGSLTLIDGGEFCKKGLRLQGFTGQKADAFCEALLCAAFLSSNLKEETGEVSASIKTDGKLHNLTVSGDSALHIRGCADEEDTTAEQDGVSTAAEFAERNNEFFGKSGFLQVVRNDEYTRPFCGTIALNYEKGAEERRRKTGWIAENFAEYFRVSEQIATKTYGVSDAATGSFYFAALQALPGGDDFVKNTEADTLRNVVEEYLQTGDFSLSARRVFGEVFCEEYRFPVYECRCSKEYLAGVLRSMGHEAIEGLFDENGEIKAHCHFCNTDYVFTCADFQADGGENEE